MAFAAASFSATFPAGSIFARGNRDVVAINPILLRSLADAVDLMRYVVESSTLFLDGNIKSVSFQARLPAWKRGQIISSAAYIREMCNHGEWSIPRGAVDISGQLLDAEAAYREELEAASLAGIPWQRTLSPMLERCMRCGEKLPWRFVLKPPPKIPPEIHGLPKGQQKRTGIPPEHTPKPPHEPSISHKRPPLNDTQERNTEIALFRYSLIGAQLFDRYLPETLFEAFSGGAV